MCLCAGRWECPWHDCSVCGAPASSLCDFCPRSFCQDHEAGALAPSSPEGRLCCSSHNPVSPPGSNSSSSQPHCSALSPVRVKEEPETELGLPAAEWHCSAAQYLIPCKSALLSATWASTHLWSEAARYEREYSAFTISVVIPIQRRDTDEHLNTLYVARAECLRGKCLGITGAVVFLFFFPPSSCHNTTSKALYSSPAPVRKAQTTNLIVFFFVVTFTAVEMFKCCHDVSHRRFKEIPSEVEGEVREEEEKATRRRTSPPPCCSAPCLPAVGCGRRLITQAGWTETSQPLSPSSPGVVCHRIYPSLPGGTEEWWLILCNFFFPFSGPHYIPTFLDMV